MNGGDVRGPLFYVDGPDEVAGITAGDLVEVRGEEAHHAVAVRRLRVGEPVSVGDGSGTVISGTVESTGKDLLVVRAGGVFREVPRAPRLGLIQALAKAGRDELAVQAATEVGVDGIVPWQAERSIVRWSGEQRAERGRSRWQAVAREAAKQSLRARIPEVAALASSPNAVRGTADVVMVLDPHGAEAIPEVVDAHVSASSFAVVVGPEGGFSEEELAEFLGVGAHLCVLGETVLRTSTAGPVALGILSVAVGRWPGDRKGQDRRPGACRL